MEKMVSSKKLKRVRKHGFMAKMATFGGRKQIKRRMHKGRARLTV